MIASIKLQNKTKMVSGFQQIRTDELIRQLNFDQQSSFSMSLKNSLAINLRSLLLQLIDLTEKYDNLKDLFNKEFRIH
jgi:hypothetical protein